MQMVLMTFRSSMEDDLLKWLKAEGISFTYVGNARGKGETGQDLDRIYGGGTNTMLFAGIPDEQLSGFRDRAYNLNRTLTQDGQVSLPFHVFVLPCIQWF
ncbi:MAG TPA: hypothetical protein VN638_08725 [Nitrospiraceae bacterium]|nr:hypothetical protein [Nitrospiraceae bacterium]